MDTDQNPIFTFLAFVFLTWKTAYSVFLTMNTVFLWPVCWRFLYVGIRGKSVHTCAHIYMYVSVLLHCKSSEGFDNSPNAFDVSYLPNLRFINRIA